MKYAAILIAAALLTALPLHAWLASDDGFDAAVSAVEQQYHARPQSIPLQWFVGLCATISTGGGVHGLRVADFEHISDMTSPEALATLFSRRLSPAWSRMVLSSDSANEFSLVYVRPDGHAMRMLVASYDHGELDIVRMNLNGRHLAHFVQNPAHAATSHKAIPD